MKKMAPEEMHVPYIFLQTHGLRAELYVVLRLIPHGAVLVFHRVEADGEVRRRDAAALLVALRFEAIAFARTRNRSEYTSYS